MGRFGSRAALLGAVMAAAILGGCGSSGTSTTDSTTAAKVLPVALHLSEGSYSVSAGGTTISGTASKNASIFVNGRKAVVHSGQWHDSLHLHIGSNQVEVEATMGGRAPTTRVIHVIRHHTTAELEANARARALRAEEQKRHQAEIRERVQRLKRETEEQERATPEEGSPGGECPNGTYENSSGNIVCKPYAPGNGEQPAGATAECEDGTYSFSEHRSGTCSGHGGVKEWLNE